MDSDILASIDKSLRTLVVISTSALRKEELSKSDFVKLVTDLNRAGLNGTEIANILGVNKSTVSRTLKNDAPTPSGIAS